MNQEHEVYDVVPTDDEKLFSALCHGLWLCTGGVAIIPLIIWLIKKDESDYIDYHGREALNFQITVFILGVVIGFTSLILSIILIGYFIALICLPLLGLFSVICSIVAAVRAYEGTEYRYPLTLRIL